MRVIFRRPPTFDMVVDPCDEDYAYLSLTVCYAIGYQFRVQWKTTVERRLPLERQQQYSSSIIVQQQSDIIIIFTEQTFKSSLEKAVGV